MEPRVSVLVPCYNYGHYIAQTLTSLLEQTLPDFEILVVDDASTDNTPEVLARFSGDPRLRILRNETNKGNVRSFNDAVKLLRGRYWSLVSADDYCIRPDALERQVALFESDPRVGMVYSAYNVVDDTGIRTTITTWPEEGVHDGMDEFRKLMWGNYVLHSGTMLRRDVHDLQGGQSPFDPRLPNCGDWDLWLRAAVKHRIGYVAEPLYAYRMHQSNMQFTHFTPGHQASQNVLVIERAFAELPADAPADILRCREAALQHAYLQTAWFHLFNGKRLRAWQGLAWALRQRPRLVLGKEFYSFLARLSAMTVMGGSSYRQAVAKMQTGSSQRLVTT